MDGQSPSPNPCPFKHYKKNGQECGELNCKKHSHSSSILRLTSYIRASPAPLCYETIAGVFPHLKDTSLEDVLQFVYDSKTLRQFSKTLGYNPKASAKIETLLQPICTFMRRCWQIESSRHYNRALQCLQNRWREQRSSEGRQSSEGRRPSPLTPVFVNAEDPITLEPLEEIPEIHRWSYRDSKGNLYGFHASSLLHFIDTQGAWNPYTRETIPEKELDRLRTTVNRLSHADKTDFTVVWNSPRDAFADILYDYEKYGFYTSMDWFLNLKPMDIINIYTLLNNDPFIPKTLFRLTDLETSIVQDPECGAAYYMAREMREIIKDNHDFKFYIVCNIFVAMAKICPYIRRSLPSWTQAGARAIT